MSTTDPIVAASIRALIGSVLLAAQIFLLTWAVTDDWRVIITTSGGVFVSNLIIRGGFEGGYDQRKKPDMNKNVPPASNLDGPVGGDA